MTGLHRITALVAGDRGLNASVLSDLLIPSVKIFPCTLPFYVFFYDDYEWTCIYETEHRRRVRLYCTG